MGNDMVEVLEAKLKMLLRKKIALRNEYNRKSIEIEHELHKVEKVLSKTKFNEPQKDYV